MEWPRVRFTIWNVMIMVAAAAGLLAATRSPIGLFAAFGMAYLALIGVLWWMFPNLGLGAGCRIGHPSAHDAPYLLAATPGVSCLRTGFGWPGRSRRCRPVGHEPGMGRPVPCGRLGCRTHQWQCRPDHRPGPIRVAGLRPSRRLSRPACGALGWSLL